MVRVADIILKVGGVFCFSLFGYLLVRHGWDNHYLVIMSAGLLLFAFLYATANYRATAVLLVVSLAIPIYATNVVLAVEAEVEKAFPRNHWLETQEAPHISALAKAAKQQGHEFDIRARVNVMLDLRKTGVDAWPSISAAGLFKDWPQSRMTPIIELDGEPALPLGGISNKVTVYCNENGPYILLDNDEHGFANPKGLWSLSQLDIAVIGDSFAHGACVSKEDSFPALLRQRFPATLNLGNDANGPLTELATLSEYLPPLKPKIVLWAYFESNDLTDLVQERQSLLVKYLDPNFTQGLIRKQGEIDRDLMAYTELVRAAVSTSGRVRGLLGGMFEKGNYLREFEQIMKLSYVWKQVAKIWNSHDAEVLQLPIYVVTSQELELFRDVLKLGRDRIHSWGGEMVFVYLPQFERYSGQGQASLYRQQVLSIVAELGIRIIDIAPVFSQYSDPLDLFPFRNPGHYTPNGYQIVAREIDRYLETEKLLQVP